MSAQITAPRYATRQTEAHRVVGSQIRQLWRGSRSDLEEILGQGRRIAEHKVWTRAQVEGLSKTPKDDYYDCS